MTDSSKTTRSLSDGPIDQPNHVEQIASGLSATPEDLIRDATCNRCGYKLCGLLPEGNCPECNFSIWVSLQGDALVFADPDYIRRLIQGTRWIKSGMIVILVAITLYGFLILSDGFLGIPILGVASLVLLLSLISILIGIWVILKRDRGVEHKPFQITYRSLGRLLLFLSVCLWLFMLPNVVLDTFHFRWYFLVTGSITVICMWCVSSHLLRISIRLRNQSLQGGVNGFRIFCSAFFGGAVLVSTYIGEATFGLVLVFSVIACLWVGGLCSDFRTQFTQALDSSIRYHSTCKPHSDVKTDTTCSGGTT